MHQPYPLSKFTDKLKASEFSKICSICLGVHFNSQHHYYSLWQNKKGVFHNNVTFDHLQRQRNGMCSVRAAGIVIWSNINQLVTAKLKLLTVTQWTVSGEFHNSLFQERLFRKTWKQEKMSHRVLFFPLLHFPQLLFLNDMLRREKSQIQAAKSLRTGANSTISLLYFLCSACRWRLWKWPQHHVSQCGSRLQYDCSSI